MSLPNLDRATIAQMGHALEHGEISTVELVEAHLARIDALDDRFNAVIERNPQAIDIALTRDEQRRQGAAIGPLHGIPVLVKDNIDSGDAMQTTAGSLALVGAPAASDATVVSRLRASGAVIIGKTNLSEWANFRSTRSSSGWSSRGGQTRNAYDLARTPGGSSSGSGVGAALGMCAAAIGTETDGSIVGPSAMNGIVGIKPTLGRVSRYGIIPISCSQDTAGPMARTVHDAAALLLPLVGEDPRDPQTTNAAGHRKTLTSQLDAESLRGARVGVARNYCGYHDRLDACFENALSALKELGATIVDPVDIAPMSVIRPHERIVMEYEFKAGLNAYFAARSPKPSVSSLEALIAFNSENAERVMPYFDQDILCSSNQRGSLDDAEYRTARETSLNLSARDGIDAALLAHHLDAIVAPTTTPAWLIDWINGDNRRGSAACAPAVAGYPHVTVPMGYINDLPVGLSLIAGAWDDQRVINFAYAFEQYTLHRRPPEVE